MLLKKFKEEDEYLDMVGLSRSHAYSKIRFHDFLLDFTLLRNSNLAPS